MRNRVRAHVVVSIAAAVVFARAVPYPLQVSWDDGRFIVDNRDVLEPSWQALRSIASAPHFEAYHPLHLLSYWLDVPWAGAHGPTLHAVNLALWIAALNLLLGVFLGLGLGMRSAVLATLAYGLHPVQVEAVSWATGRKDVLALLLSCAALLWHLRAGHWLAPAAWLSRLGLLLAALAKTSALPLPAALVLLDVQLRGRTLRQALRQQLPALLLAGVLALGVIAIWSQQQMVRTTVGGLGLLPARMAATLGHQLGTALWPATTSPMYSTTAVAQPGPLAWVALLGVLGAAILAYRRGWRRALFALGSFVLLLLPVSNLVPMYFAFQDRYLSLPLLGLAFGFGAAIEALSEGGRRRAPLVLGALLVAALALRCVQYQGVWASEPRLWGHAASTQPDAYYAFLKLGEVRRRVGDLHGSIRAYLELLRIDPARKLGHAALLQAVALRDERIHALSPTRAERYAADYYASLEDPEALRALAARMLKSGHLRALELPMGRALALQPVPDPALERAAQLHFAQGRPSLGLFYLEQMRQPTRRAELTARAERAPANRLVLSTPPAIRRRQLP